MKELVSLCIRSLMATVVGFAGTSRAGEVEEGFVPIFDGRTFDGWHAPIMSYWSVEDGAITGRITREHPCHTNQYLVWQGGEVADFALKLRSRVNGDGAINNGFQFRSRLLPDGDVAGYQVDNNLRTDWLVRLYDEFGRHTLAMRGHRTRWDASGQAMAEPIPEAAGPAPFRLEDWHEYHLTCVGPRLSLRVNGQLVAETIDHDPRRADSQGILALQLHSGPPTVAQFKDVRLKILRPASTNAAEQSTASDSAARAELLQSAPAYWDLGVGGHVARYPLRQAGDLEFNVRADGPGARPGARVAVLRAAHFDAGPDVPLQGEALTVYVRSRDPSGRWNGALLTKGGSPERAGFSLVARDGMIQCTVNAEASSAQASFALSEIDPLAWHDFAVRYDGKRLEMLCDGRAMVARPAQGALAPNREPLRLGATAEKAVPLTGELEEAAVWLRALSDAEVARLMGRGSP